jgi:hypothetical protein
MVGSLAGVVKLETLSEKGIISHSSVLVVPCVFPQPYQRPPAE